MVEKIQQRARVSNGTEFNRKLVFQDEQVADLVERRTSPGGNIAFTGNSMGVRGDTLPAVPEMIYSDGEQIRTWSDNFPAVATFLFDFAKDRKLPDGSLFTRSRTQTYWDLDGILRTAQVNEPAFDHDPVTGRSLGLVMNPTATNEVLWAEDLTNGVWSGGAVTSNLEAAPNLEQTADRVVQAGGAGSDFARQTVASINVSTSRVFSVFLKLTGQNEGDGTVDITVGATTETVSATDRWLRYDVKHDFGAAPTNYDVAVVTTASGPTELLIWGAQSEATLRTSYIKTESSTFLRSADSLFVNDFIPDVNLSQGTWFLQFSVNTVGGSNTPVFFVNDGTQQNRFMLFIIAAGSMNGLTSSTVPPANSGGTVAPINHVNDEVLGYSFSYELDNVRSFQNGAVGSVDPIATLPVQGPLTAFRISGYGGTMAKLAYYNEVLQNDRAQALSEKPGSVSVTTKTGDF